MKAAVGQGRGIRHVMQSRSQAEATSPIEFDELVILTRLSRAFSDPSLSASSQSLARLLLMATELTWLSYR